MLVYYLFADIWEPVDNWLYENIYLWPDLPTSAIMIEEVKIFLIEVFL